VLKDFLSVSMLCAEDLALVLGLAERFKADPYRRRTMLANDSVVLYFNKPSTRTRLSFETAVARLGGMPMVVGPNDLQLGRGETIEDTARVVARYAKAFVIRTYSDAEVRRFALASDIPVINALTDLHHPCQSLADLLTLRERFGQLAGLKLAYVGDGNNVAHSLIEAAALAGIDMAVATPALFAPDRAIVAHAQSLAKANGGSLHVNSDPVFAVDGADAVYTDVWSSMGTPNAERAVRLEAFRPYQVDARLMGCAKPGAIFMHCLPDHRGEEVTAEVVDGPRSVVFDQAENRLHTSVAILSALLDRQLRGAV
jgi:ornithine carbamoyltransferase